ncbi:MAG TPA: hypothetical protein VGQ99_20240 [Tepidisphaeraceae bacterium]|nr:hypothetical protein [Tepidisphaeraceae bacterium]
MTSRTPSEVHTVLGPHGVEKLLADARDAVWREYPAEGRTLAAARKQLEFVFERNMKVWGAIKKPTPAAFFEDLQPHAADGFIRQALVTTWMMMPRAGGRDFKDSGKIVRAIFQRLLAAWEEDDRTFTKGPPSKKSVPKKKPKKKVSKK